MSGQRGEVRAHTGRRPRDWIFPDQHRGDPGIGHRDLEIRPESPAGRPSDIHQGSAIGPADCLKICSEYNL